MVRVAGVAGAAVLGLTAVVLSVVLGPPRFARDSLLDRFRLVGDPGSAPESLEAVDDGTSQPVDVPEPLLGVPVEVVLAVLVTTVAAALLVRSLLRARHEPSAAPDLDPLVEPPAGAPVDIAGVREAVRHAARGLDEPGRDAADVVVGCWVRLEEAGGTAGTGRRPSDTPTDFAHRLAAAVPGLDPDALLRLRAVYSRVRFGPAGATAGDVGVARAALADLVATLDPVDRTGPRT
ncbi:DUF4129 domain-containing protein [Aquipuribacter sp. MA13-13]